ncbi:hypothetical protein K443DRAFT_581096 [Laccaria amethystina LaAM-08-1]|uniref:Uncharacterized protein n=1 Tax=Laccaria amethystina LaAM-08-1 TaxID=1095629 RepID=A0A0C9XTK8_9AGAR|nr:hypothetical protein K443DRAFT_581096 [Laccaria amethystina LaAM-08-1]
MELEYISDRLFPKINQVLTHHISQPPCLHSGTVPRICNLTARAHFEHCNNPCTVFVMSPLLLFHLAVLRVQPLPAQMKVGLPIIPHNAFSELPDHGGKLLKVH